MLSSEHVKKSANNARFCTFTEKIADEKLQDRLKFFHSDLCFIYGPKCYKLLF